MDEIDCRGEMGISDPRLLAPKSAQRSSLLEKESRN